MLSILEQILAANAEAPISKRSKPSVRSEILKALKRKPLQTSGELAEALELNLHSVSAEFVKMRKERLVVREIDKFRKMRYRLYEDHHDKNEEPILLSDQILELMKDGEEWDSPKMRAVLSSPPARSVNQALQRMVKDNQIEVVRTVSFGSAHRKLYRILDEH